MSPGELAGIERVQPPIDDEGVSRTSRGPWPRDAATAHPYRPSAGRHRARPARRSTSLDSERRGPRDAWLSRRLAELTEDERALLRCRRRPCSTSWPSRRPGGRRPRRHLTLAPDSSCRCSVDRNVPIACPGRSVELSPGEATRLAHRDLDAAGRPGLACSQAHQLWYRARHRHRAAVPALVAVRTVGRRCSRTATYKRKRSLATSQTGLALVALILSACSDVTGIVQYWQVLVLACSLVSSPTPIHPVRQGRSPIEMVGPDDLTNAVGVHRSTIFNSARIRGPAVAGVMITAVGTGWAFVAQRHIRASQCWPAWPDAPQRSCARRPAIDRVRGQLRRWAAATCGNRQDLLLTMIFGVRRVWHVRPELPDHDRVTR